MYKAVRSGRTLGVLLDLGVMNDRLALALAKVEEVTMGRGSGVGTTCPQKHEGDQERTVDFQEAPKCHQRWAFRWLRMGVQVVGVDKSWFNGRSWAKLGAERKFRGNVHGQQ
ncbi:unnamed protein product [Sphenostylis stenocarpa]|uniref:Uncharacterized protein n=1 Tax=Sphenostylis stenocarpa TaxID=92480 RepID=A0AA86T6N8_9FABA|nr:unnamed protein product [Sphenostylis stenocarpa]